MLGVNVHRLVNDLLQCDEARPSCSQCRRGGRKCPGYERNMKFVDEGPQLSRKHRKSTHPAKPRELQEQNSKTLTPTIQSSGLNRAQLVACFVSDIFPFEHLIHNLTFLGSWLWQIPRYIGTSPALDAAAQCLALAYRGRDSCNSMVLQHSRHAYIRALHNLSKALQDPRIGLSSEILCASMLLGQYEVCISH